MAITFNHYDFEGKVVIVTGCARGIGRAIARAFGENGAKVVACDLNLEGAQETVAPFEDSMAVACNIADEHAVKGFVDEVVERYGNIDVLMNNAGIFTQAPVTDMSAADWHKLFGGDYMSWAYNATKHAVVGMVRSLCIDYGPLGVRINAVAPAMTATDMNRSVWSVPEKVAPFIERIPMARIGQVEDIARAAVFLASEDAGYITGQVLCVDGGVTASDGQAPGEYEEKLA